ncbi:GNAT family N-acetyltransferase, partial [Streptomyces sp. SID7982]|nr:GNAT family N-acetyltransferase [Streptomyces sp. SID7982]
MSRPAPSGVRVRTAEGPADREACFAVRKEVFVAEQGVDEAIEYDTFDATDSDTVHVLAEGPDGPLGTGRLLHGPAAAGVTGGDPGTGSLGRLAVRR